MLFLAGVVQFLCGWGFANKRESCMYDPVYYLRSRNTTKYTLNIMFLRSVFKFSCIYVLFSPWKYNIGFIFKLT